MNPFFIIMDKGGRAEEMFAHWVIYGLEIQNPKFKALDLKNPLGINLQDALYLISYLFTDMNLCFH